MNETHLSSKEEALKYVNETLRNEWDEKLVAGGFEKVGPAQIKEETAAGNHKAWAYYLEGMPVSMDARTYWLLDTAETVETSLQEGEGTIEVAYQSKYGKPLGASNDNTDAKTAALTTLNTWLSANGSDISESTLSEWNITPYKDSFVFSSSGGRRSNGLYLVLGDKVRNFSLPFESTEAAYDKASSEG